MPSAPSNATPQGTPTPIPTAESLLDEHGVLWHSGLSEGCVFIVDEAATDDCVTDSVDETVFEIVMVDVSVLLGEVEPDVRSNMTLPAGNGNGSTLPRVLCMHVLDVELPGPQQKVDCSGNGKIPTPLLMFTKTHDCESKSVFYGRYYQTTKKASLKEQEYQKCYRVLDDININSPSEQYWEHSPLCQLTSVQVPRVMISFEVCERQR